MINSDFMDTLLDGVEVEWKALEEVFNILAGGDVPKDALSDIKTEEFCIPILSNGIGDKSLYGWTNKAKIVNPSLTISARGTIGWTSFRDEPFFPIVRLLVLTPKIEFNLKYAYHFMKMIENDYKTPKTGIPQLTKPMIKDIKIPIPCPDNPEKSLEIQAEIVRILDTFTELTAELTAELEARKKQYTYYRDQLLSFEEGEVEWKPLGDIARIQRGASPRPINNFITDEEDGIPWIKIGDTIPNSKYVSQTKQKITLEGAKKSRILKKGDFIMSNSMSFGRPYILNIEGAIHDGWASISDYENKLNSDFLYHFLSSDLVLNYWNSKINSGSVSNLNADIIKSLEIPIPTLSEQERIARVLDNFDTLTSSITEGLPREIELRQKQYEYYRNMLLSFPKEEV